MDSDFSQTIEVWLRFHSDVWRKNWPFKPLLAFNFVIFNLNCSWNFTSSMRLLLGGPAELALQALLRFLRELTFYKKDWWIFTRNSQGLKWLEQLILYFKNNFQLNQNKQKIKTLFRAGITFFSCPPFTSLRSGVKFDAGCWLAVPLDLTWEMRV